jgi:RND family efflux transporter MFP subunit
MREGPATSSHGPARRRRLAFWWSGGIALALAIGLGLWLRPWDPAPVPVAVETAAPAPVTRVLAVNGRVAALHSVDVRALVSGQLAEVLVEEGGAVQSGTELARLDSSTQQAMVRQAVAGLDAARVAREQAAATYARTQALGANVARSVLEDAERSLQAATQDVTRMTTLVEQAQIHLADYTISAPITGTVLELNVEPGQNVDPSTVLLTIADLSQLVVETDVDEAHAMQIRAGQQALLQLLGDTTGRGGRVAFVSQRVDPATGGLAVKLAFDDPVTAPVGLTVTANIIVERRDAAITVPRTAIRTGDDGTAVLVVVDGIAHRRPVAVIDWPAARLIVTDGLAPGDVVIVDSAGIVDGQAVRVERP